MRLRYGLALPTWCIPSIFDATSCARRSFRSRRSYISTLRNGNCPRAVARIPAQGGKPGNPERNDRTGMRRARESVRRRGSASTRASWSLLWHYRASSAVSLWACLAQGATPGRVPSPAQAPSRTRGAGSDAAVAAPMPLALDRQPPFRSTRRLRRGARAPSPMGTLRCVRVGGDWGLDAQPAWH